jgi:hypothetical protein
VERDLAKRGEANNPSAGKSAKDFRHLSCHEFVAVNRGECNCVLWQISDKIPVRNEPRAVMSPRVWPVSSFLRKSRFGESLPSCPASSFFLSLHLFLLTGVSPVAGSVVERWVAVFIPKTVADINGNRNGKQVSVDSVQTYGFDFEKSPTTLIDAIKVGFV